MRIIDDVKLDFKDVLFVPKRSTLSTRRDVDLTRTFNFKHSKATWTGIPIMAANMDGVGTIEMAEELANYNMFTCLAKHFEVDEYVKFFTENTHASEYSAYSMGITQRDFEKYVQVQLKLKDALNSKYDAQESMKFICIDVANGYTQRFIDFCKMMRDLNPTATLIAGNVVTPEITEELILSGVDIVKVGIGPGGVCTTRKQTGVGYPQLSAIIECADAAHGLGGYIIGDGGCAVPGDVAKAFGGGADFVMLGSMLAGHKEGGGDIQADDNGEMSVIFYGMSSNTAMEKHVGSVAAYRSSEGKTVKIPYKGEVEGTVQDLLGGLRSTCTYIGAKTIKEVPKRTTFVRVTQQLNGIFNGKEV